MGREERYRTVISGMEPRRIAVVMLLPRRLTDRALKVFECSLAVNEPRLPKFAEFVFRFSHAIAVRQEDFSRMHLNGAFLVAHVIEKAYHGAASFEAPHGTVPRDEDGRQVTAIAVRELMRTSVVD